MCSMIESVKICFSMPTRSMREAGAGSRLKTQGRSQSFDNEWTQVMAKSSESKEKWLMSDTAEKVNAQRKQPLAKQ